MELTALERPDEAPVDRSPASVARRARSLVARHPLLTVFTVALVVRAAVAILIFARAGGTLFNDDAHYTTMTADAAAGAKAGWDEFTARLYRDTWAFTRPIALLKWVFGGSALVGQLVVATAGAATASLTTKLARLVARNSVAVAAGLAVALLPSQVLWSSLTLKDPFVWMFTAATAWVFARAARPDAPSLAWLALLPLAILLDGVRFHSEVIVVWAVAGAVALIWQLRRPLLLAGAVAVAVGLPLVLGHGPGGLDLIRGMSLSERRALNAIDADTAVVAPVLTEAAAREQAEAARQAESEAKGQLEQIDSQSGDATDEERAALERERERLREEVAAQRRRAEQLRRAAAVAAKGDRVVIDEAFGEGEQLREGAGSDLRYLPRGIALMLFEPYPWARHTAANVRRAQVESAVWYPLLAVAALGLTQGWRHRRVLAFPVAFGAGALLATALTEGNFGTAYRHRSELVWVLALLGAAGVEWVLDRRDRRSTAGG